MLSLVFHQKFSKVLLSITISDSFHCYVHQFYYVGVQNRLFSFQVGKEVGKAVNTKLMEALKEEDQKGLKRKTVGFLR